MADYAVVYCVLVGVLATLAAIGVGVVAFVRNRLARK